jgi:hypothetical protein
MCPDGSGDRYDSMLHMLGPVDLPVLVVQLRRLLKKAVRDGVPFACRKVSLWTRGTRTCRISLLFFAKGTVFPLVLSRPAAGYREGVVPLFCTNRGGGVRYNKLSGRGLDDL